VSKSPETPELKRPAEKWGSTSVDIPDLGGGYTVPPGENGDRDRRELLARVIAALYSCVGSAQRAPVTDEEKYAVQQVVISSASLATGEADAFLTLISCGLEGPAVIHLRSLGELSIRAILCRKRHDLAALLYRS